MGYDPIFKQQPGPANLQPAPNTAPHQPNVPAASPPASASSQYSPQVPQGYAPASNAGAADAADRPVAFQWKFKDAEPYYVRIDNGSTTTGKGLVEHADVTLKTSWADWVDVATRGHDARLAMLRGKIRPRGSLRQLARMRKIFPPRPASSRQPTASLQ